MCESGAGETKSVDLAACFFACRDVVVGSDGGVGDGGGDGTFLEGSDRVYDCLGGMRGGRREG